MNEKWELILSYHMETIMSTDNNRPITKYNCKIFVAVQKWLKCALYKTFVIQVHIELQYVS
jgi:hypothetical protein